MEVHPSTESDPGLGGAGAELPAVVDDRMAELTLLLKDLDESSRSDPNAAAQPLSPKQQNQLAQVRLGIASSLFTALRWKHEPTAEHCLRVALGCSSWALRMGLPESQRDEIEVAALLHDIGKIGVPDQMLAKPRPLSPQESAVMDGHWLMGGEILRKCCASISIQETVSYARAWYDGSKREFQRTGEQLPLGARMLSIVDAFDAMITDHVYRRALSRERAFNELFRYAGRQFDPELVQAFSELHEFDQSKLQETVSRRWLHELDAAAVNAQWRLNDASRPTIQPAPDAIFQQRLLDSMYDAVVFIDGNLRIVGWNHGAERLSGISRESVYQRDWLPSLLNLRDEHGDAIREADCPVTYAARSGAQWRRRLTIRGRGGESNAVDAHAVPVTANDGTLQGLTLVLHDVSPEISLEERCQSLHELATRDPLTQLANRAEFDRVIEVFVAAHLQSKVPCSLIIADLDHFKLVNDTYGHQVGDEVIQSFAGLLRASCRSGDLVARYGGEEFVMLCAGCDSAAVVRRAEELRRSFSELSQPGMGSRPATASFGATEIQPGDTPETMLRRADRALLTAKEEGRNKVVQLGSGGDAIQPPMRLRWQKKSPGTEALIEQNLITEVPLSVSVEKLRGFVSDHHAKIESIEGSRVLLSIGGGPGGLAFRRNTDRPTGFHLEVELAEERTPDKTRESQTAGSVLRTKIHIVISPHQSRDRRRKPSTDRARQLLVSFRAYLMACEAPGEGDAGVLNRAKLLLTPWRNRR
jgi:diguanylate cyclase (GGDEF)-like protein/PAS domain S-box-containing protein